MSGGGDYSVGGIVGVVAEIAGLAVGHSKMAALQHRAGVFEKTEAALQAVLSPQQSGAFSHDQRAALACRIARLNDNEQLALFYKKHIADTNANASVNAICDPGFDGGGDAWLKAVLAFTDLVSGHPKDATENDVSALQAAGISDPDIVRLAELNAFLAYHIKVIEGLVLLVGQAEGGNHTA